MADDTAARGVAEGTSAGSEQRGTPPRLAIIGGGPRALWAVEELLRRTGRMDIDVYEPQPQVGAGRVYRSEQSPLWRMNLRADRIATGLGTYEQWREERNAERDAAGTALDEGYFPPRREMGLFLAASWDAAVQRAPEGVRITHRRATVYSVRPTDGGSTAAVEYHGDRRELKGPDANAISVTSAEGTELYDEVLIATGHAQRWPGQLRGPRVYDDLADIPAGAHVGVRGSALTFIDAALELTLGRGGRIVDGRYLPSGNEPVLYPANRSGRFMEVKPMPGGGLDGLTPPNLARYEQRIPRCSGVGELIDIMVRAAGDFLEAAGQPRDDAAVREVFEGVDAPVADAVSAPANVPVAELRHSLEVATGHRAPGAQWAAGEAWRRLYSVLVDTLSYEGRDRFPGFGDLRYTMERVAFGPPADTIAPLLAVIDAGVVRVGAALGQPGAVEAWLSGRPGAGVVVDGVYDATIAPPGVNPGTLSAELVEAGQLEVRRGPDGLGRGADVRRDGSVPGWPRVAVIGRDVEDTVLDHDTLSRTLHLTIPRWADAVVGRATESKCTNNEP